jgi:rod shape-determining protein MreC
MRKEKQNKKKADNNYQSIYSRMLPAFFALLSLLMMVLPLQKPVNSVRAVLSYIFIPQLRMAHATAQYLGGVSEAVDSLISVAAENRSLKDEIAWLKIGNAQLNVLRAENERLANILNLSPQLKWQGSWAKVVYREPSRHSTIIVDKGSNDGVSLRAPVIGVEGGVTGLLGKIIEVTPKTSKILLSTDEEFFVAAFLSQSLVEGLAAGDGKGGLVVKYIPLEVPVKEGEKVYTSVSSAIFPDGVLIGTVHSVDGENRQDAGHTFLTPRLKLAVDPLRAKEVLILAALDSGEPGGKAGK